MSIIVADPIASLAAFGVCCLALAVNFIAARKTEMKLLNAADKEIKRAWSEARLAGAELEILLQAAVEKRGRSAWPATFSALQRDQDRAARECQIARIIDPSAFAILTPQRTGFLPHQISDQSTALAKARAILNALDEPRQPDPIQHVQV